MPDSTRLAIARRQLANGVGQNTQRNRVLPFSPLTIQIPARVGVYDPGQQVFLAEPPPCLQGEIRSAAVAPAWTVAWHADEPVLLSSDAVWRLDPTPWRRWSGYTLDGNTTLGDLVHFNFSSPTTAAALDPAADPAHIQMVESAWSSRTWYAKQQAVVPHAGLLACVQRLQAATFTQDGVTPPYAFTWTFSDDGEATTDATTPACLNRTGHETGLDTRVYTFPLTPSGLSGFRHIQRLSLIFAGYKTAVETTRATGFLPSIRQNDIALYVGDTTGSADNLVCTDLAKILSIGQPWHGLCTGAGIERPGLPIATPAGYFPPVQTNTRYFKAISPPGEPATALLPPNYTANHYQYLDDVVLLGGTDYSPKKVFATAVHPTGCSDEQWYHCDDAGVVRRLAAVYAGTTANSTKFNIYNLGPCGGRVQPSSSGTYLTQLEVVTTDADALAGFAAPGAHRIYSGSGDYQVSNTTPGGIISPNLRLAISHPIAASPNGRQIALLTGAGAGIATVATFDIASDLTISGPTYVYQHVTQKDTDAVTTHTWRFQSAYNPGTGSNWWVFQMKMRITTATMKIQEACHAVAYDKTGALNLFIRRREVFKANPVEVESDLSPTRAYEDSGVPLTDPAPTTSSFDGYVYAVQNYPDTGSAVYLAGQQSFAAFGHDYADNRLWTSIYRIANNLVAAIQWIAGAGTSEGQFIAAPTAIASAATVWPTSTTYQKWASWNPRTNEIAGRNDNTGAISWI